MSLNLSSLHVKQGIITMLLHRIVVRIKRASGASFAPSLAWYLVFSKCDLPLSLSRGVKQ